MDPLEFVYKRVDTLELKLDVYLPADASQEKPAPICIWWHGGGLFQVRTPRSLNNAEIAGNEKAYPATSPSPT